MNAQEIFQETEVKRFLIEMTPQQILEDIKVIRERAIAFFGEYEKDGQLAETYFSQAQDCLATLKDLEDKFFVAINKK